MKPLRVSEDFVSLGEFKAKASKLLERLKDARSVVITHHGKPAGVLISPEEFDELRARVEFIDKIRQGLADVAAGRVISDEELAKELEREFAE